MTRLWIVVAFTAGTIVGWAATRQFTPDWIEAAGTWAGAVATIATIIWAVHTFREESRHREEVREDDKLNREQQRLDELALEQKLAGDFVVRCFGGGGYGPDGRKTLQNVHIEFTNGLPSPVSVVDLSLLGVKFKKPIMNNLPASVPPGETHSTLVEIDDLPAPDDQFSRRPLTIATPVVTYRVRGVTWQRTGDTTESPRRVD